MDLGVVALASRILQAHEQTHSSSPGPTVPYTIDSIIDSRAPHKPVQLYWSPLKPVAVLLVASSSGSFLAWREAAPVCCNISIKEPSNRANDDIAVHAGAPV